MNVTTTSRYCDICRLYHDPDDKNGEQYQELLTLREYASVVTKENERLMGEVSNITSELALVIGERDAARSAIPRAEIPAELFDGYAIYSGLGPNAGITPRDVAAVLDEVVRQIRANRG